MQDYPSYASELRRPSGGRKVERSTARNVGGQVRHLSPMIPILVVRYRDQRTRILILKEDEICRSKGEARAIEA